MANLRNNVLLVYNWPHSVGQNHFFVKMFFIRDSDIQKCSKRFCTVCKTEKSGSLPAVRTTCHPVRTLICPLHQPSGRRVKPSERTSTKASSVRTTWIPVRTFLYVEKHRTAPACIRPDDPQCSIKLQDFLPNTDMGRLLQPSKRHGFPSRRAHP
jgi:hypothetical protein